MWGGRPAQILIDSRVTTAPDPDFDWLAIKRWRSAQILIGSRVTTAPGPDFDWLASHDALCFNNEKKDPQCKHSENGLDVMIMDCHLLASGRT